jgi:hypothetical protein
MFRRSIRHKYATCMKDLRTVTVQHCGAGSVTAIVHSDIMQTLTQLYRINGAQRNRFLRNTCANIHSVTNFVTEFLDKYLCHHSTQYTKIVVNFFL